MIARQTQYRRTECTEFASDPRVTIRIIVDEIAGGEDRIELMEAAAAASREID